jgi:hypothetical protein
MSDLLAIIGPANTDEQLVDELSWRHPDRVTVLLEGEGRAWAFDDSSDGLARRDRLAALLHAIEQRTGAAVVGLVGDAEELKGWRFDRVVRARTASPVAA